MSDWEIFFCVYAQTFARVLNLQFSQTAWPIVDDIQNVVYLDSRGIIRHWILLTVAAWPTWMHARSVLWWMQLAIWGLFRTCLGCQCWWIKMSCGTWWWLIFGCAWFFNLDVHSQWYSCRRLILLLICVEVSFIRDFILIRFFSNGEWLWYSLLVNTGHLLNWLSKRSFWHRWLLSVHESSLCQCHIAALRGILFFHCRQLLLVVRCQHVEAILLHNNFFRALASCNVSSHLLKVCLVFLIVLPNKLSIHDFVRRVELVLAFFRAYGIILGWHLEENVNLVLLIRFCLVGPWIDLSRWRWHWFILSDWYCSAVSLMYLLFWWIHGCIGRLNYICHCKWTLLDLKVVEFRNSGWYGIGVTEVRRGNYSGLLWLSASLGLFLFSRRA